MIIFAMEYLSWKLMDAGIGKFKDKSEVKKVYNSINQFDISFTDTDVDSNAFQKFLNEIDIQEEWFSQVFQYEHKNNDNKESFIDDMVRKALTYINNLYKENGRKEISANQLLREYFKQLYSHLEKKRAELFSLSETAQLTVISELVWEVKEDINNKIEDLITERKRSKEDLNQNFENRLKLLTAAFIDFKSRENPSILIQELDKEILGVIVKERGKKTVITTQVAFRLFYDACLNYEDKKIALGMNINLFERFKQIIIFLREFQETISKDTKEGYLRLIKGVIDEDTLKLLIYCMIYLDERQLIECFDEIDIIDYYFVIAPPLDIFRGRSFWEYIVLNTGKLDPYALSDIIGENP